MDVNNAASQGACQDFILKIMIQEKNGSGFSKMLANWWYSVAYEFISIMRFNFGARVIFNQGFVLLCFLAFKN